ncbi:MAG: Ig-like domain-containing protein [Thermoplasmata archaeon]|nr:MAG: Ig-like domain-containing protein [Thermoplasmata archaeon]
MFVRRIISLVLLITMLFSPTTAFMGELLLDESKNLTITDNNPPDQGEIVDLRGTRAESNNINMVSKMLFGPSTDVHVVGNYAYVTAGCSLLIFDVTDPGDPTLEGFYDADSAINGIFVEGNYAYLANSYSGLNIVDLNDPSSPTSVKTVFIYGSAIDVYLSGTYAYVAQSYIISGFRGISVVNVQIPQTAEVVGTYESDGTPYCLMVSGDYAYVASEGEGFLILDVSNPTVDPTFVGLNDTYSDPMTPYTRDVFVREPYAFVVDYFNDFHVFNITDPSDPLGVAFVETDGDPMELTLNGDYAYIADGDAGLTIIDISVPTTPGPPINHGTLDSAFSIFVEGTFAYLAIWGYGLQIVDVSGSPPVPTDEGGWITGYYSEDIHVVGNYAYIADEEGGLKILDVSDPSYPVLLGFHETGGWSSAVFVEGDYAYLAEGWDGITVVDVNNPTSPTFAWSFNIPFGNAEGIFVLGSYAYAAYYDDGLRIININTQEEVGDVPAHHYSYSVHVIDYGDFVFAYVGDSRGLIIANVTDPDNPSEEGFLELTTSGYVDIYVTGSYAYLADSDGGLTIVDITNSSNPTLVDTYDLSLSRGVYAKGTTVYVTNSDRLVAVDSLTLTELGYFEPGCNPVKVQVVGQYAYVAAMQGGSYILDISQVMDTTPPQVESTLPESGTIDVSRETDIEITFNENLDHGSSEDAFFISPTVNGEFNWNGNTLIFTPEMELDPETDYTVTIEATAMDTADNTLDGNKNGNEEGSPTDDASFGFTTSAIPPTVETVFPDDGSTSVIINTHMNITFSKPMDQTSTRNAFSYSDGVSTWTATSGDITWSDGDRTMIFTPDNLLENDKMFNVTVASTAQDTGGTPLDGDGDGIGGEEGEDDYTWSFTTAKPPPQILSTQPKDGALNQPVDITIIINFSKTMNRMSVEDAFNYTNGLTVWDAGDGIVSWSDNDKKFSFIASSAFGWGMKYEVGIAHTAMDITGIFLDGDEDLIPGEVGQDDYSFSFTTIPLPPRIFSTSPGHGSSNIMPNTEIIIDFSTSMDRTSTRNAFSYTDGFTTFKSSSGQISWSNGDRTMTFESATEFAYEQTYIFTIAHTATDSEGAPLDGDYDGVGGEGVQDDYSWSFTTIPTPPKVLSVTPGFGANKVEADTDIVIRFSKSMDHSSVEGAFSYEYPGLLWPYDIDDGNVSWSSDSRTMTFEPDEQLDYETVYTVIIDSSAKDEDGITLDGNRNGLPEADDDYSWTFTTIKEPPKLVSVEPDEDAEDVAVDADIVITFNRSMDKDATESAFSYTYEGSDEVYEIRTGTPEWTDSDKTLTFTPDADFAEGVTYTITIDDSAKDAEGVIFEGFEWEFTTKVNSPPVLKTGGVNPDSGDASEPYTFSVVYSDADDDEPRFVKVVIDGAAWKMQESDTSTGDFIEGKVYELEIELDAGDHTYYFEAENEQHVVRLPSGESVRSLNVTGKEKELIMGIFEEEYSGIPTMVCGALGIIILIAIIISVILITKRRRAGRAGEAGEEMMTFETFDAEGGETMTFLPEDEEDLMSFTAFEEEEPVIIQCPECNQHLKVTPSVRPFMFPCKCGAKLMLK